jgi:hypothetical protein
MKLKILILFVGICLLSAGCKPVQQLASSSKADSTAIMEVLTPRVVDVHGDSVKTTFTLDLNGVEIKPATVEVSGATTQLTVSVSSKGQVTAKATTPARKDTLLVPQRTERTYTATAEVYTQKPNAFTAFFTDIKKWLKGLFMLIGLAAIVYLVIKFLVKK